MAGTVAKVVCVLFMCMVVSEAALNCNQVQGWMAPCLAYLTKGGNPNNQCCTNLRNMVNSARTTTDRRNACKCLKAAASKLQGQINAGNAAQLPSKCNVNIPYKISMSTNCANVN